VDFVLGGGEVAVEVKGTSRVDSSDLRSLKTFVTEFSPRQALVVCNEKAERIHEKIKILPWRVFLRELWEGKIIR
jgi:predicted AAA+ superfamily ATPase